jgi:hypothetical protein
VHRIVLAALLAAVALPTWAANDERLAFKVCEDSGTPGAICVMKYAATEAQALNHAEAVLDGCRKYEDAMARGTYPRITSDCPLSRAYIKQRWGY